MYRYRFLKRRVEEALHRKASSCGVWSLGRAPYETRHPEDHINRRFLHSGSKAQYTGDIRNTVLQDPSVYVAFWGPRNKHPPQKAASQANEKNAQHKCGKNLEAQGEFEGTPGAQHPLMNYRGLTFRLFRYR